MKPMVRIKVVGYNLDQLINKLYKQNIECYNIERTESNVMFFSVKFKKYRSIKPLLKNYEYHIQLLGLANFKHFLVKNLAIMLVVPFVLVLMVFSTKFTWNIKVCGVEGELKYQVLEVLKQNNIKKGNFLPSNSDEVEQILLEELPNVAQVSCIARGTTLIINVSEKLVYTPETYEPIKAKYSGIITNFSLISGTMAVGLGEFVSAGDILVYPFTLDKDGNQVSVKPIAEVVAKAYIVGTSKLNASTTELMRTGRVYTTSSTSIFNKKLFSKKSPKPFALYESCVYNEYISSVLPVVRTKTTYYELDYVLVNYDLMAEKPRVEQESIDLAYKNLPTNSSILDEQTTSIIVNDCLYSTTTLTISTIIS